MGQNHLGAFEKHSFQGSIFTESKSLGIGAWGSRFLTISQGDSDLGIKSVSVEEAEV